MTDTVSDNLSNIINLSWQPQGGFIASSLKQKQTVMYSPKNHVSKIVPIENQSIISLRQLDDDISVIMRQRAQNGYLMNCEKNYRMVNEKDRKLGETWLWMERAVKVINKSGQFNNMDYNLRGVYQIWMGPGSQGRKASPSSTPRPNISSPQKRSSAGRKKDSQPTSPNTDMEKQQQQALQQQQQQQQQEDQLYIISSTTKSDQRKVALATCGFDMTKNQLEEILKNFEANGEYDKAAAWSVFNGLTDRAIECLSNIQDVTKEDGQQRKLMSVVLAGYQTNSDPTPTWRHLCESLSKDLVDSPYLKAIFQYIASSNWDQVLTETAIPLQERVAIALRFLDDDQLTLYLGRTMDQVIMDGDIEGLVLTGLSTRGIDLLEKMVNRYGDIQTAALLVSFVVPRRLQDSRAEEWIESYRLLLDRWQFWHTRAKFDIERGKYMNASEDIASPQVYVRCTYCAQTLGHSLLVQNIRSRDGKRMNVQANISPASSSRISGKQKATVCPSCRKPLPRCALCLLHMGTPIDSVRQAMATNDANNVDPSNFGLWFTWCQTCRHGGHSLHLFDWFQKHSSCPVSNCACQCQIFTE
ncbi:uncharacterized protein BX664DRAFT_344304 [Halteromyces radiatus]|uniref:uncharacterized protein n=1 Tax=Halteromyces radiatus TaxID=101107 RepID=UPI0022204520|nr:uncharacterized protein BX664DRAFT_344304 [Halteromyces radiatus]KAI8076305.1 hypothetical protein BX664DRAFT_344304 [Halteromyces radiatus]